MAEDALYFAYGSNLDPDQMLRRCPSARPIAIAALAEHRLEFTVYSARWRGGAADVLPEVGQRVWGALYRIAIAQFAQLDRFEGNYRRSETQLELQSGAEARAFLYRAQCADRFTPSPEYLDTLLRGARHWGLPEPYTRALAARSISPSAERRRPT